MLAAAPAKTRAERTARVSTSVSVGGQDILHATGLSRLDRERTRLHFTYDTAVQGMPAGTEADAVSDGDEQYIRLEKRRRWVHVPKDGDDSTFSTGVADSLDYLSAVTGNAKPVGEATIRGARTRVYAATVDLERVAGNLPVDERAPYRKKLVKEGFPTRLPLKAAIDDQGRIVRMDYSTRVRGSDLDIRFEMYDFGAKGDLAPPRRFVEGG